MMKDPVLQLIDNCETGPLFAGARTCLGKKANDRDQDADWR